MIPWINKDFTENLLSGTVEYCNLHDASDVIKLLTVDSAFRQHYKPFLHSQVAVTILSLGKWNKYTCIRLN